MEQYIPKAAVVAEIEKKIEICAKQREDMLNVQCHVLADDASARMGALNCIKDFINTLEVREVDLEKEINNFLESVEGEPRMWHSDEQIVWAKSIAKHFLELGIRIRTEEIK